MAVPSNLARYAANVDVNPGGAKVINGVTAPEQPWSDTAASRSWNAANILAQGVENGAIKSSNTTFSLNQVQVLRDGKVIGYQTVVFVNEGGKLGEGVLNDLANAGVPVIQATRTGGTWRTGKRLFA